MWVKAVFGFLGGFVLGGALWLAGTRVLPSPDFSDASSVLVPIVFLLIWLLAGLAAALVAGIAGAVWAVRAL